MKRTIEDVAREAAPLLALLVLPKTPTACAPDVVASPEGGASGRTRKAAS